MYTRNPARQMIRDFNYNLSKLARYDLLISHRRAPIQGALAYFTLVGWLGHPFFRHVPLGLARSFYDPHVGDRSRMVLTPCDRRPGWHG